MSAVERWAFAVLVFGPVVGLVLVAHWVTGYAS